MSSPYYPWLLSMEITIELPKQARRGPRMPRGAEECGELLSKELVLATRLFLTCAMWFRGVGLSM